MSWRPITEDDVQSSMTSAEVTAVRGALLSAGQSDPLARVIEQVTLECRTAVKSCSENVLSAVETELPGGMVYHAVAIIRYRLLSRFGLIMEHGGESRLEEYRVAQKYLRDVATCLVKVDRAGAAEDEAAPKGMSPKISARDRRFSRRQQEGI